jgi:hypothetical protein
MGLARREGAAHKMGYSHNRMGGVDILQSSGKTFQDNQFN